MHRTLCGTVGVLAALTLWMVCAAPALALVYTFTKVADSTRDGFDPSSFECSSINNKGDIAFRTARPAKFGPVIQGVYRATADRKNLTTIFEVGGPGHGFDFLGQNPCINDLGEVAFAVRQFSRTFVETQSIMIGGSKATLIADTSGDFSRFGFEPTINNSNVVPFKAELDNFDEGLFSSRDGRPIVQYYLSNTSQFSSSGSLSRPSIKNFGTIAFEEGVDGQSTSGIFVTNGTGFTTIAAPDSDINVDRPNINDLGTVAFHRFFNLEAGEELVTGTGIPGSPLTVIAKANPTAGPFKSFGFYFGFVPPALNNKGQFAFLADLNAGGTGIFTGTDPVANKVIQTGDTPDGEVITSLRFCDKGLNDSGQLVFQAGFGDPFVPHRVAIFRATPAP
jgi:hypothetical protein